MVWKADVMARDPWLFDRFLRYDELVDWLHGVATDHPQLVSLETYGSSSEGRDLWLVTVSDETTAAAADKPAHWVDANIHSVELTAGVAACNLIDRLVNGHASGDPTITRALATRTFYIAPRVNPDGVELALADSPIYLRSSTRPWPRAATDPLPGLRAEDVDGDGRVLQMRIADPDGAWMPHPDDNRLLVQSPPQGAPDGTATYRLLTEGSVIDYDGYTVPTPRPVAGLDLNRNFPAGWGTGVLGSGDHPLSEPEIHALARAIVARPNICGAHAFHTAGGVLLRPSSTRPDSTLSPFDVWVFNELGAQATAFTSYPVHSVFEDFTWDQSDPMSGAADDWLYEHFGIFSWTTEFWDVVKAATGTKQATTFWYIGPSTEEALAVLRWTDEHNPDGYVAWREFDHPQLGPVEIGGWDFLNVWTNPPGSMLKSEVDGHADAVIAQVLASPSLALGHLVATPLGDAVWRVDAGVSNTGWLATDVSALARKENLCLPGEIHIHGDGVEVIGGPSRQEFGQLDGRAAMRFRHWNDGTPDRALVSWTIRAEAGTEVSVAASHSRAGSVLRTVTLAV